MIHARITNLVIIEANLNLREVAIWLRSVGAIH